MADIARFSLNDGPGIRTTVFLKGCPLRCIWCHNPENISPEPRLLYRAAACVNCGGCISVCPSAANISSDGKTVLNREKCVNCGRCAAVCPSGAREFVNNRISVEEVLAAVQKDILFYQKSGGGLTVSGGEPLMFPDFTAALLRGAKAAGIGTAVETCGWAGKAALDAVLPYCDVFLFDYKETDRQLHQKFTGRDNDVILRNLDYLCKRGASVILRCPIIPGLNDRGEHFAGIALLAGGYPAIRKVELMPYHKMGVEKRTLYGFDAGFIGREPENEEVARWYEKLRVLGCDKL